MTNLRRHRSFAAWGKALAVAAGVLWQGRSAVAAEGPAVNFRRPFTPMHADATLAGEPTASLDAWTRHLGLWLSYADDVVEIRSLDDEVIGTPVQSQFSADAFVNYGVGPWLTLGLLMPVVLHQSGEAVEAADVSEPPASALGDLAVGAKVSFLSPSPPAGSAVDGFGLAWLSRVSLPTGNRTSYVGDGQVTVEGRALAEYVWNAFAVRGAFGGYWRPTERTYVGEKFGNALTWGGSVVVEPYSTPGHAEKVLVSLDARGEVALVDPLASRAASPAFLGATGSYHVGSWGLLLGAEVPMSSAVGSPQVRVVLGAEWYPHELDLDADGIVDARDKCPDLPEDQDGVDDDDGCPDLDADEDGVPDDQDRCLPDRVKGGAVEDRDGFEDEDGCPDPDNDGDGVLDADDACPDTAGDPSSSRPGCPRVDADGDGIEDSLDKCPSVPEDVDDFEDDDGCPDSDNDGDGVVDSEDACPMVAGTLAFPPSARGCPLKDADGDTFPDDEDACVGEGEDFNGVRDDDGCPDALPGRKDTSLITTQIRGGVARVVFRSPPTVVIGEDGKAHLAQESLASVRAIAQLLLQEKTQQAVVMVRPGSAPNAGDADQSRLKAMRLAERINELVHDAKAAVVDDSGEDHVVAPNKGESVSVTLRRRDELSK